MSGTMSVVEVKVTYLGSDEFASKLKRSIFKLKGVKEVEIHMKYEKVIVRGNHLEQRKVLRVIRRLGKAAEPWSYPLCHSQDFPSFYKHPIPSIHHYYQPARSIDPSNVHPFRGHSLSPAMAPFNMQGNPTNSCSIM